MRSVDEAFRAVLLLAAISGALPRFWEVLIILAVFIVLTLRVRYVITSEGVAINNVVFRPWSDFTGVTASPRRLELVPKPGLRPFYIQLVGKRQEEALQAVKPFVVPAAAPEAPTTRAPRRAHVNRRRA